MEPYRTAEARWFRRGPVPADVRAWFDGLGPAPEPESRTDLYLAPDSAALGVKVREGQLEAKRRDGAGGVRGLGRSRAAVEDWAKWSFSLVVAPQPEEGESGWVAVGKTRWQRHADGCALELSEVTVADVPWWSVCLEASGPDHQARHDALARAAERWLGADDAPALAAADAQGYAAWLLRRAEDGLTR